uniref:Phospho-2-dehydro-3-deoxyheptonate aldolase n=1 Tax=Rhizophora mucronata TaxID=61149 RepID=A0A2P2J8H9_RHIMU
MSSIRCSGRSTLSLRLCLLVSPGHWRSGWERLPWARLSCCREEIVPRVLRSSTPITSETLSGFFFRWAPF